MRLYLGFVTVQVTSTKNEEFQKAMDKWKEDMFRDIKIMNKAVSSFQKLSGAFSRARYGSRLPYSPSLSSVDDDVPPLPSIFDDTPEVARERQLKALRRSIVRMRKLSAEDMLDIYVLHVEKKVSFRSMAKKFKVSEWTIRKTFSKVVEVLDKVADKENS